MIPFVIPDIDAPTELVNLLAIKRIVDLPNGDLAVDFTDGEIITYEGKAAQVIKGSCHMCRTIYERQVMAILDPSQIVTPAGQIIQ